MADSSETRDEISSETTNLGDTGTTLTPNPDTSSKKFDYEATENKALMPNRNSYTASVQPAGTKRRPLANGFPI
jgi:hypothetical protein